MAKVNEAMEGLTNKQKVSQRAGIRSKVTTDMYNQCMEEEQKYWENEAKRIGEELKANWLATIKTGPAQTPEERQGKFLYFCRFLTDQPLVSSITYTSLCSQSWMAYMSIWAGM